MCVGACMLVCVCVLLHDVFKEVLDSVLCVFRDKTFVSAHL